MQLEHPVKCNQSLHANNSAASHHHSVYTVKNDILTYHPYLEQPVCQSTTSILRPA